MSPEDEQRRMAKYMIIGMWVLLVALLIMTFSHILKRQNNPNQELLAQQGTGNAVVRLKRNRYGHYVASGRINGEPVTFMLDTGATDVAVPARLADQLGLQRGRKRLYQTAKGPVTAYTTVLNQVRLGSIKVRDVRASINPDMNNDEVLLGMSFLKQLDFSQRGDTLTLRQY
ncbi:MAG TPA: TIGR02281 family clan AA aspartic protease [Gammaproteobacteria bacterium]|nr:TIGR02281 family clan AA aspartic protease [Gammaproteobacteria bacterium]